MPQPAGADKASRGGTACGAPLHGPPRGPPPGHVALPPANSASVSRRMRGSAAALARAASVLYPHAAR